MSSKDLIPKKYENKIFLLLLPLCFLLLFNGKKYDEAVKNRLLVPVKVCLEGQDCGSSSATSPVVSQAPAIVKKVELSEGSEHIVKMLNSGDGGQMIFEPAVLKVSKGDASALVNELSKVHSSWADFLNVVVKGKNLNVSCNSSEFLNVIIPLAEK